MMYGTLEDSMEGSQPLLPNQLGHKRRSSLMMGRQLQGLTSVRHGPVLQEILMKPRRLERDEINEWSNDPENLPNGNRRSKSFLYTMLNPRSNALQAVTFKWFISLVIVLDLVSYTVSTDPDLTAEQIKRCHKWEGLTSSIFLVEYLFRLLTVSESKKYSDGFSGRLRYAITIPALVDLIATVPFFLELIFGWDLPTLTWVRAFRLLRILKTSGFSEASKAVYRVIYFNRQILYVALLICVGLVLVTAILMYYLRPRDGDFSQDFRSLGATMYLSTLMLTGQGGPEGDLPWYTKGVVLLTGVFSIGMFAIPASMLTWGFEAEAERCAQLAYRKPTKTSQDPENDTWSYSSEDYSTDEEYLKIIAGEGDDEDDEDAEAKENFALADIDGSGNISLTEFLALSRQNAARHASNNHELVSRITLLEKKVDENSQKLDRICQLLETMQKK